MGRMVNQTKLTTTKLIQDNLITKEDLIEHLKSIGIQKGMVLYVQSSLEYFSYICGGNRTLVEALQEVVGYDGCIVTNAFSYKNTDPLDRDIDRFKPYQIEIVRDAMPSFSKKLTPSNNKLANQMMRHEGVYRSNHPIHSFIAWGKYAKLICDKQPLHFSLSKDSPLGKLCELNGFVLLLGIKYEGADIFKVGRVNDRDTPIRIVSSPIERRGKKSFINMLEYDYNYKNTMEIQQMLKERQIVKETFIGRARCRLFNAKEALTLSSGYFHTHTSE